MDIIPGISLERSPDTLELRASTVEVGPTPTRVVVDAGTSARYGRVRADVYNAGPAIVLIGTEDQVTNGQGHRLEPRTRYEFRNQDELWAAVKWLPYASQVARNHTGTGPGYCVYWADTRIGIYETFDIGAWLGKGYIDLSTLPFGDVVPSFISAKACLRTNGAPGSLYMAAGSVESAVLLGWKNHETWRRTTIRNCRPEAYQLYDAATDSLTTAIPADTVGYPGLAIRMTPGMQYHDFLSCRIDGQELVSDSSKVSGANQNGTVYAAAGPDYTAQYIARSGPRGNAVLTIADHRARPAL